MDPVSSFLHIKIDIETCETQPLLPYTASGSSGQSKKAGHPASAVGLALDL